MTYVQRAKIAAQKTINITYPSIVDQTVTTVTVPESEPTTGQVQITVASSDFPTFDVTPSQVNYCGFLALAGKNNDSSARTVNYKILKNSTQIASGNNSVAAGYYWTFDCYNLTDLAAGDVIEARIWCTTSGHNVDYRWYGYCVNPSRLKFSDKDKQLLVAATVSLVANARPTYSIGGAVNSGNLMIQTGSGSSVNINSSASFAALCQDSTYGIYRLNNGDNSTNQSIRSNSTYMPYITRNYVPSQLIYSPCNAYIS